MKIYLKFSSPRTVLEPILPVGRASIGAVTRGNRIGKVAEYFMLYFLTLIQLIKRYFSMFKTWITACPSSIDYLPPKMKFLLIATMFLATCVINRIVNAQKLKEKVFLLVFDGFVHDFEKLTTNTPNFDKLASEGVKAKGLIPPFPPGKDLPSIHNTSIVTNPVLALAIVLATITHLKSVPKNYVDTLIFE